MLNPDRPNWAPLLIIRKRHVVMAKVLIKLPLEFGTITCSGIIGTCNCFGSICESRRLNNLKTHEIKTSLWVGCGNEVELQQALSKYGG